MAVMKTPGVYIVEKNAFPNSVVQVATAVPAFIGYTEKAMNGNTPLTGEPQRLTSLSEFHQFFGGGHKPMFDVIPYEDFAAAGKASPLTADGFSQKDPLPRAILSYKTKAGMKKIEFKQTNERFCLYGAMRLFFQNGGGACYVISVGNYDGETGENVIEKQPMLDAIKRLKKEPEPTMVVIPETTRLTRKDSMEVQQQMLSHCGKEMRNRFAILDMFGGYAPQFLNPVEQPDGDPVAAFRSDAGTSFLDFGAAYYPWVNATIYGARDFDYTNINLDARPTLINLLRKSVSEEDNSKELITEIKRISIPEVKGDLTITVTDGGESVIAEQDMMAEDDESGAAKLTYTLTSIGNMKGSMSLDNTALEEGGTFTQQDVTDKKVKFTHEAGKGSGSFQVTVTDEAGITTAALNIAVEVVGVLVTTEDAKALTPIEVLDPAASHKDLDPKTVMIKGADDKTGKKKTIADVGVFEAAKDTGKITFTPVAELDAPEIELNYMIAKDADTEAENHALVVTYSGATEQSDAGKPNVEMIDKTMRAIAPLYVDAMNAIAKRMNSSPPSAAMAGLYTMVDNTRGVWKAPANVSMAAVTGPMLNIDDEEQQNLNVSTTGKSINAIRPFVGEGTLVWGARTLDGNSLDWRYVSVRRTMIMIEESIRLASKAYVFEPNTSQTWVTMRSMIENFLTSVWKQGGLAGAVPSDAFSVHVGLGDTMTPVDILEGILRITVLVAVTRPAEFIEITFMQQMQKS